MMRTRITVLIVLLAMLTGFQVVQAGSSTPPTFAIEWSPDGRWIGATSQQGIWFFDTENPTSEPLHYLADESVPTMAFDATGTYAAVFDEGADEVPVIEIETGEVLYTLHPAIAPSESFSVIYDIDLSGDGLNWIVANTSVLYVYDVETGEEVTSIFQYDDGRPYSSSDWITSITEDTDASTYTTSTWQIALSQFDLGEGRQIGGYLLPADTSIYEIAWQDGSDYLVLLNEGMFRYDTATRALTELDEPTGEHAAGFALNQERTLLAIGGSGQWVLYDVGADEVLLDLAVEGEGNPAVFSLAFNPDATRLATLQTDGAITVWDVATGSALQAYGDFGFAISYKWG